MNTNNWQNEIKSRLGEYSDEEIADVIQNSESFPSGIVAYVCAEFLNRRYLKEKEPKFSNHPPNCS